MRMGIGERCWPFISRELLTITVTQLCYQRMAVHLCVDCRQLHVHKWRGVRCVVTLQSQAWTNDNLLQGSNGITSMVCVICIRTPIFTIFVNVCAFLTSRLAPDNFWPLDFLQITFQCFKNQVIVWNVSRQLASLSYNMNSHYVYF